MSALGTIGRDEALHVVGAGPAGLAAAISAARSGLRVVVHELRSDVGTRFHGDFQGLENWTTEGDVVEELAAAGIEADFEHAPRRDQVFWGPDGREYDFHSDEPFYYLVRRGTEPGTLDQALKRQALDVGVEIRFRDAVHELPGGGIVAHGPRGTDAIAVGYLFDTDMPDGTYATMNDDLAPKGYSYLLVDRGRGTVASCMFGDFHNEKMYLERTVEYFDRQVGISMTDPRPYGGTGNVMRPATAMRDGLLFVGEAAGFQDALWGFGIRYALLSGALAAQAFRDGDPASYERRWKERFGALMDAGMSNRFFFARGGNWGYTRLLRSLHAAPDPRAWLRRMYGPSFWKSLLTPLIRPALRLSRRHREPVTPVCSCTWCRTQHRRSGDAAPAQPGMA